MSFEIREYTAEALPQFSQIPIAFKVTSFLRVELMDAGLRGICLWA